MLVTLVGISIIIFVLLQKQLIRGIQLGGVKG